MEEAVPAEWLDQVRIQTRCGSHKMAPLAADKNKAGCSVAESSKGTAPDKKPTKFTRLSRSDNKNIRSPGGWS